MSRPDGFQIADIDVGLLDDPKFRRLWRDLHDQGLMCEAVVLFVSTLLESWSSGLRVPVDEAMPIWLDPTDGVLEGLRRVGLLTSEGFVSESGWSAWFGPAAARREQRRTAGRAGGKARPSLSDAKATLERTLSERQSTANPTDRPTDRPTDLPAHEDAREDLEAFLQVRFRAPTEAQRRFLDDYCRVFDVTGPARAAQIIFTHPDDPIGALKDDLKAFRAERSEEARKAEQPKPQPRRKASGLDPVSAELARMLHENGGTA